MRKILFIIITFVLFFPSFVYAETFNLYSDNVLFYNLSEDKVMYEKNADEKAMIASLTKVISVSVILDYIDEEDFDKKIDFKKVDFKYLQKNDLSISSYDRNKSYTYRDFLYSFVMESSADCGYALSYLVASDIEEFSSMMNKKAKSLGMNNSHFDNPVGIDSKGNYSTMRDMVTFMKSALKNKTLKELMSTFSYKASDGTKISHTIKWYTEGKDLKMPYLKGGKTGYNDIPGFALLSYAEKDGVTYILATTNADYNYFIPRHFVDAKTIYDYYFKNYGYKKLLNKNDEVYTLDTKYTNKKVVLKASDDVLYYLKNNYKKEDVSIKVNSFNDKRFSYKKGDKLGKINVYYKDTLVKEIDAIACNSSSFSFIKFISYNKLIFIAGFVYFIIIFSTYLIIRKIKNRY